MCPPPPKKKVQGKAATPKTKMASFNSEESVQCKSTNARMSKRPKSSIMIYIFDWRTYYGTIICTVLETVRRTVTESSAGESDTDTRSQACGAWIRQSAIGYTHDWAISSHTRECANANAMLYACIRSIRELLGQKHSGIETPRAHLEYFNTQRKALRETQTLRARWL